MPEDKPHIRRVVRAYLAERPAVSQTAETIQFALKREHAFTIEQVCGALLFLTGLGHLEAEDDSLGGSQKRYQATAKGIIEHEREG